MMIIITWQGFEGTLLRTLQAENFLTDAESYLIFFITFSYELSSELL